jgi:hypothetical protein
MLLWLLSLIVVSQSVTVVAGPPVTEIDLRRLKGPLPRQLAWSPDHTQLYLQTYEANKDATVKTLYHYVLPSNGGAPKQVDAPPAWATEYITWKSGQASPDDGTWKIDVVQEKKIQSATSIPMGGDLARGGTVDPTGGISVESVTAAAAQASNAVIYSMRLSGETVGEWINHPIVPGLTFGWGPKGTSMIAFAEKSGGRLSLMSRDGKVSRIDGTRNVIAPAWSRDGQRIAWLEHKTRAVYALIIGDVRK